jgi:hypothetical protein
MTGVIQVGNSDNKLTQQRWSEFVGAVQAELRLADVTLHFFGCSHGSEPWQNACWVFQFSPEIRGTLVSELERIGKRYDQDSIAWTTGKTELL